MFKIPEKIKIGFVDYRIEEINRLSGEKTVIGEHFEEHACIQLAQHLSPSTKAKVLIHECLHAVMAQYGICVDEEERLIGQLSTGITEMIDQIVEFNANSRPKFGTQLDEDGKARTNAIIDNKRVGELANRIAEYYKKEGNGCGGNCHLVLDDGNLEDSDIQFCKGYCACAEDSDGLSIMRDMLSMNPEERQKVYDMASVLTNPRYTNNLDNLKEKN